MGELECESHLCLKVGFTVQPVIEIATALAKAQAVIFNASTLTKVKNTSQMKDIGDFSARAIALEAAFAADRNLGGKDVLLLDDLFQSGIPLLRAPCFR